MAMAGGGQARTSCGQANEPSGQRFTTPDGWNGDRRGRRHVKAGPAAVSPSVPASVRFRNHGMERGEGRRTWRAPRRTVQVQRATNRSPGKLRGEFPAGNPTTRGRDIRPAWKGFADNERTKPCPLSSFLLDANTEFVSPKIYCSIKCASTFTISTGTPKPKRSLEAVLTPQT